MARQELIDQGDCDFNCPPGFKTGCCGACKQNNGYWEDGEMEHLLSKEDQEFVKNILKKEKGCLGDNGCNLPRNMRSMTCLEDNCNWTKRLKTGKVAGL